MYQIHFEQQTLGIPQNVLFLIGRGDKCDLKLDDPSASRVHCRLLVRKNRVFLTDAGSRWGTFVNGERVTETELSLGDEIAVGETTLRLSVERHSAATTLLPPKRMQHDLPGEAFAEPERAVDLHSPVLEKLLSSEGNDFPAVVSWVPNRFLNKNFNGYQVEELLANTRTGMTFKAVHRPLDRTVALKIFRPELFSEQTRQARFLRAVRTMIDVRLANVVQLYDAGNCSGLFYSVSEFVEGDSAAELINRIGIAGMLDWRNSLRIARDLAEALDELHERGIVHRNIKPEHILIRAADHKAMLSDVILAKAWNDTQCEPLTQQGDLIGELCYQSPELLGSGEPVDERSDLYQLGVALYALLTGRTPFESRSPGALIQAILNQPAPSPRGFHLAIPDLFSELIVCLLSKRPVDRPQSAYELLKVLERISKYTD